MRVDKLQGIKSGKDAAEAGDGAADGGVRPQNLSVSN